MLGLSASYLRMTVLTIEMRLKQTNEAVGNFMRRKFWGCDERLCHLDSSYKINHTSQK